MTTEDAANYLLLGDLRKATADLPDSTPVVIVFDGETTFSPVRRIDASTQDVALVGY